jgi:hypothetical protein
MVFFIVRPVLNFPMRQRDKVARKEVTSYHFRRKKPPFPGRRQLCLVVIAGDASPGEYCGKHLAASSCRVSRFHGSHSVRYTRRADGQYAGRDQSCVSRQSLSPLVSFGSSHSIPISAWIILNGTVWHTVSTTFQLFHFLEGRKATEDQQVTGYQL